MFDLANLSQEGIKYQRNNILPSILEKIINKIGKLVRHNNINNSVMAFNNDTIKSLYEEIDRAILKYTGMRVQHIGGNVTYAIYISTFSKPTALLRNNIERSQYFKEQVLSCNKSPDCEPTSHEDIKTMMSTNDRIGVFKAINDNMENLKKSLSTGIKINFDKARIDGLPNKEPIFIITNPYEVFNMFNWNDKEITAILLHEIGHGFTNIAEGYRNVETVTILNEALLDSSNKENKTKILKLTIEKHTGEKSEDTSEMITALVRFTEKQIKILNENDVLAFTDNEQQADNFAVRFGYGKELASALEKIELYDKNVTNHIYKMVGFWSTISFLTSTMILGINIGMGIILIPVVMFLVIKVISSFFGSDDSNRTTFDTAIDRYRRIRNDMIREIRNNNYPKELTAIMISDIDSLEQTIAITDDDKNILQRLGDSLPWNSSSFNYTQLQRILEDLNNNNLHLAKIRLEQHLNK